MVCLCNVHNHVQLTQWPELRTLGSGIRIIKCRDVELDERLMNRIVEKTPAQISGEKCQRANLNNSTLTISNFKILTAIYKKLCILLWPFNNPLTQTGPWKDISLEKQVIWTGSAGDTTVYCRKNLPQPGKLLVVKFNSWFYLGPQLWLISFAGILKCFSKLIVLGRRIIWYWEATCCRSFSKEILSNLTTSNINSKSANLNELQLTW